MFNYRIACCLRLHERRTFYVLRIGGSISRKLKTKLFKINFDIFFNFSFLRIDSIKLFDKNVYATSMQRPDLAGRTNGKRGDLSFILRGRTRRVIPVEFYDHLTTFRFTLGNSRPQ